MAQSVKDRELPHAMGMAKKKKKKYIGLSLKLSRSSYCGPAG